MAFADIYRRQVALLFRALPHVAEEKSFALKGGTGINLFVRDMPRLSVDVDLTYLPVQNRAESLAAIDAALARIAGRIRKSVPDARVTETRQEGRIIKLVLRATDVQTLIEVTPVMRGSVFQPEERTVPAAVEETFGFAKMPVVSFADLYAGKIVAALDRQHPRDLFDVRELLANEGIDDSLRRAFVAYMLSHDRPMHEVLGSKQKDVSADFTRDFEGMTDKPVKLQDLLAARTALVKTIVTEMPEQHRKFLVSFEKGEPDWKLLGLPGVEKLPAVLWRQENLNGITAEKRSNLVEQLERVLGM
jgi:predicted nucleotidyltransferase component of viral defense system